MTEGPNEGLGALFNAPDAGNQGPGDALRRAREAQRISIEALAANIKVSVAKLEALESGRFAELPDANFTRALAMTLCRVLKVDPAAVLPGLPAARPATLVSETPPLNQPFKASRASMHLFDRSVDWAAFLKPKWLAPAGLLIAAAILYTVPGSSQWPEQVGAWFQTSPAVSSTDGLASDAETPEAAVQGEGQAPEPEVPSMPPMDPAASQAPATSPPAVAAAPSEAASADGRALPPLRLDRSDTTGAVTVPAAVPSASAIVPVVASAPPVANSLLSLRAQQATWVEIKDAQGNRLLGRLIQRDEAVDMSVPPPLTLRIGNAAGMTLSFKGQVVDLVPHTRNNVARLELK
jgi:cytoskeleton protein RodZ